MSQNDPLIPMIFHNRWWLDAATGGDYDEIDILSEGVVAARLPYVIERAWPGYRVCTMPQLTHSLGWAVDLTGVSTADRHARTIDITRQLAAKVSSFSGFHHKLHGGIADTSAFNEAGYATFVQFTFEIVPQPDAVTWRSMRDKTRNVIRRAEERFAVSTAFDPDEFSAFYDTNLRSLGLANTTSRMAAVCSAALSHDSGRFYVARGSDGAVSSAIFIVWDRRTAYYLLSTRSPASDNGVVSLLIWQAIRDAHASGLVFDFDGVGTPGSRVFFTGFGGAIQPRYIVSRFSPSFRAARLLRGSAQHLLARAHLARSRLARADSAKAL